MATKVNNEADLNELVIVCDGKLKTTSLLVAKRFNKQHAHVLRAIQNLECSVNFAQSNFGLAYYTDAQGKERPFYNITRDGFTMLAMGFTGAKAATWKEKYIAAFNTMEHALRNLQTVSINQNNPEWNVNRILTKRNYQQLADTIHDVILPETSLPKEKHFVCFTREAEMINIAVFGMPAKEWRKTNPALAKKGLNIRDMATVDQLVVLTNIEYLSNILIKKGVPRDVRAIELQNAAREEFEYMNRNKNKSLNTIKRLAGK